MARLSYICSPMAICDQLNGDMRPIQKLDGLKPLNGRLRALHCTINSSQVKARQGKASQVKSTLTQQELYGSKITHNLHIICIIYRGKTVM